MGTTPSAPLWMLRDISLVAATPPNLGGDTRACNEVACRGSLGGPWLFVLVALVVLLVFTTSAFAEYRTVEIESLRITVDTDWATQGTPGYFPVRLDITNLGDTREIRVIGSEQRFLDWTRRRPTPGFFGSSSQLGSSSFSKTLRLKRGDRVKFTLPVPMMGDHENISVRIFENGRQLEGFVSSTSTQSGRDADEAPVLFVGDASGTFGLEASGWVRSVPPPKRPSPYYGYGGPGSGARAPAAALDFVLSPDRVPESWLGLTSLRAVAVAPTEWGRLTPQQKESILTWAASGGDLIVVDGSLDTVLSADARPVGFQTAKAATYNYYLGHIHLVGSDDIRTNGFTSVMSRVSIAIPYADWTLPVNRSKDWTYTSSGGFRLPIEGVGGVPTKAYLSMLLLFTVVIGPLNYLYLWRKRLQVLLVLTVPLISLVFIGVLTAYAFIGEGLTVRGRAATFTVLDQTTKHAATRSSVSMYAGGIAPSGGLMFPPQFAIFPQGTDGTGPREQVSIDFTDSQRFSNGMLQARSPSNFEQIAFGPARERLNIERSGNEFSVVNGLGSAVTQLYYRENGRVFVLNGTLDAGQKGSLRPGTVKAPQVYAVAMKYASSLNPSKFENLVETQPDGTYLAVLEKSPFWDPGVAGLEEHSSFHLVLGYVGSLP